MKNMIISGATALCVVTSPVWANSISISPGLPGWQELTFDDLKPNRWSEESGALVVESADSSSMLYKSVSVSSGQSMIFSWRWRVDETPPPTDLTRKGSDDRPISVTICFAYEPESASLGERMKRVIVEQTAGADAPGRVLELTWGGNASERSISDSPHYGYSGRIITMRGAGTPMGQWMEESIDVAALYRQIWGTEPPPVSRIAVLSDSDDTHSRARAQVTDMRLETSH